MVKAGERTRKGWRRDRAIVRFVNDYRNRTGNGPSIDEIADYVHMSYQGVNLRVRGLIDRGELGCDYSHNSNRRRPNSLYVIEDRYSGLDDNNH